MKFEILKSKVYIQTDAEGCILHCNGGYTTPADLTDWTYIDEGIGDKYNLCQSHYFEGGLYTMDGIPRYRWDGSQAVERSEEELEADRQPIDKVKNDKVIEIRESCSKSILAGIDVETSKGLEHFSLEETDQINLTTALSAIQSGAASYPYHADKELCRLFTAKEIQDICNASIEHKLYHTTLCNHLLAWIRRSEDVDEINSITYSQANMPDDLRANMMSILSSSQSLSL